MALKRAYDYRIEHKDCRTISVETMELSRAVLVGQSCHGYYDEVPAQQITVSFDQLEDLIQALEDIRIHHVPREWTPD